MRIAIIGGGWYGCHIASMLNAHGVDVTVLEKHQGLFAEASGNNQFRLHLGLHYPRSSSTRHQSRDGFARFSERYPNFSRAVPRNLYVVPKQVSLMDFDTYFSIMYSSGIHIEKVPLDQVDFLRPDLISGVLSCDERVVLTQKARSHFTKQLARMLRLESLVDSRSLRCENPVIFGSTFDGIVDATWGALSPRKNEFFFEPTLLLYYQQTRPTQPFPGLTLVDGRLWSIYPTETDGRYTLSSVRHTPFGRFSTKAEAYLKLKSISSAEISATRKMMESEVRFFFPEFNDHFTYEGPQLSIKTKPVGLSDDRSAAVSREGKIFRIQSGKIDTIFHAGDVVVGALLNS